MISMPTHTKPNGLESEASFHPMGTVPRQRAVCKDNGDPTDRVI